MDCSIICILSMVVQNQPHVDNLKCAYCMNVDALSTACYEDPLACWQSRPDDLLYCLTTIEYRPSVALKARRCVAQPTFPMDRSVLAAALRQPPQCDFAQARACNCTNCVAPPPTTQRPFQPQYPPPRLAPPPRNRPKTLAINVGQNGKKEFVAPRNRAEIEASERSQSGHTVHRSSGLFSGASRFGSPWLVNSATILTIFVICFAR